MIYNVPRRSWKNGKEYILINDPLGKVDISYPCDAEGYLDTAIKRIVAMVTMMVPGELHGTLLIPDCRISFRQYPSTLEVIVDWSPDYSYPRIIVYIPNRPEQPRVHKETIVDNFLREQVLKMIKEVDNETN